ncbi:MAG: LamG-like jellyroll fold domain-containing protein, partial [Marinoscillum sp.]
QNSYIITFDENLEIKDWYEAKGLSSNTIFIVLGGKPYFILNHFDQSPRSDVYSYQNINQASILFKLGPDARISHIFSDQDQSYYIKTANDASQYLVKVKEDFSESATYAIPENLYFISNSPNIEEDYNFLIFRDKSTRDLFYAKRPGAILEPVQEVSAQGTLLFSQGVYHTKETLVMSGSTGDFFFDLSASELRTYWEIPAAIIMSLLTFFGHAVLLRHGSAKSKSSNSKILKINTRTGFEIIPLEDILYCKADGKYTAIQTTDKQFLNVILSIVLSLLFLTGCNKSDDKILPETESVKGTVSLGVNIQNSEKSGNGRVTNDPIPAAMLITIKASDGQIIYSLEKLTLVEVNGSYVSTTIELDTGSYTIEDFIITDANDTSIYITPKTGSGFEDLVSTPLPFEFEVLPDEMTKVGLDVVSVSLGQTSDFGYAEFTFNVVDLKAGLVAYYPFNGNANDESENENDGTVNGATLTSDRHGNSNSAYDFSGAGGYSSPAIDIPRAPELEPTNAITVSAWVNPDNYENTGIVCKRNSANGRPYNSYSISFGGDKKFSFTVSTTATGDDGYGLIQKTDFEYGTWNHVVGTYDGSKVSLYVNGVLETDTVASGSIVYSSLDLYFGRTGASNYTYDGRLDEVRIYNRALKPAEIKVLSEY